VYLLLLRKAQTYGIHDAERVKSGNARKQQTALKIQWDAESEGPQSN